MRGRRYPNILWGADNTSAIFYLKTQHPEQRKQRYFLFGGSPDHRAHRNLSVPLRIVCHEFSLRLSTGACDLPRELFIARQLFRRNIRSTSVEALLEGVLQEEALREEPAFPLGSRSPSRGSAPNSSECSSRRFISRGSAPARTSSGSRGSSGSRVKKK